jgi:hypothetical protein
MPAAVATCLCSGLSTRMCLNKRQIFEPFDFLVIASIKCIELFSTKSEENSVALKLYYIHLRN